MVIIVKNERRGYYQDQIMFTKIIKKRLRMNLYDSLFGKRD